MHFYMGCLRTGSLRRGIKQRPKGDEKGNHANIWGKSILGREKSKYRGPEVGVCLVCLRNFEEVELDKLEWLMGSIAGVEVRKDLKGSCFTFF